MRSESLIKKIGAAFTAVTVLASVGTVAFAAGIEDGTTADPSGRVTATVNVTETAADSGLYNVAINYENDATSGIGVTMLAYSDTTDGQFESSDIPGGYSETGMQIVGFDQSDATASGTFNFLVDTNPDTTNSGVIRMDEGDVGIVLLSADGAVAPTGYLFTIPVEVSFTVTDAAASETAITVPYGTSIDDVKALLEALTITVSGDGVSEDNWTATWDVAGYSETTADTYTATGTLVQPEGSNGTLDAVTTVEVAVTVEALEWEATAGTMADVSITIDEGADALEAVIAELKNGEKVITIVDADEATDYTATVAMTDVIADTAAFVSGEASPYTYKVTVADDSLVTGETPDGSTATIVTGGFDVEFTVNVAYNATGKFDATSIKAFDANGVEVTAIEVENGTSEALAIDALEAKVAKATVYGADDASEDWVVTGWTIDGYVAETAGTYTATAQLQAPDGALATIPDGVVLTVTVTVKEAEVVGEPYIVGDVSGDGSITGADWQAVLAKTKEVIIPSFVNETAADVNGDGNISGADWQAILAYTKEVVIPNTYVGETRTK